MTPQDTRKVLADYLTGLPVSADAGRDACTRLRADPESAAFLREELGRVAVEATPCARFRARVAEFAGMNAEQRRSECPEAAAHVATCGACRALLWRVTPSWFGPGTSPAARRLLESIQVGWERSAGLVERGLGPPAQAGPVFAAATAGDPGLAPLRGEAVPKVWEIPIGDGTAFLRLAVAGGPAAGGYRVTCDLTGLPQAGPAAPPYQVEVRDRTDDRPRFAGRIDRVRQDPVLLPPGVWLVVLKGEWAGEKVVWEVPLDLAAGPEGGR